MYEGQLSWVDGRFMVVTSKRERIVLLHEMRLFIHLAGQWIEGQFAPSYDSSGRMVAPYHFVCADHSFCGLNAGMRVCI
jgi:hypothetical protein